MNNKFTCGGINLTQELRRWRDLLKNSENYLKKVIEITKYHMNMQIDSYIPLRRGIDIEIWNALPDTPDGRETKYDIYCRAQMSVDPVRCQMDDILKEDVEAFSAALIKII